jgi:hypothetical protein
VHRRQDDRGRPTRVGEESESSAGCWVTLRPLSRDVREAPAYEPEGSGPDPRRVVATQRREEPCQVQAYLAVSSGADPACWFSLNQALEHRTRLIEALRASHELRGELSHGMPMSVRLKKRRIDFECGIDEWCSIHP